MRSAPALLALALSACSLAPRYERPELPVDPAFPSAPPPVAGAPAARPGGASAGDLGWRDVFPDQRLQALLALALERNRDLRLAALNVEAARAQYGIQRSEQLPQLAGSAGVTRQRTPGDLNSSGHPITSDAWSVGAGLAPFEIDFFGRVRNLSDAALQQYLATEEARRSAHLALVATVARQELTGRALEAQVVLARETLAAVEASLKLTRRLAEAGQVSELDLRTAEAQLETARFNLAASEQQQARSANALRLLLGGPAPADLPSPRPLDGAPVIDDLPAGIPSEVLVRRPDVLAAEHALRAANASVGAARAAFFPSITLTAFAGTSSAALDGLFGAGSATWSFTPRLNLPIFAGGALRAGLDLAEVRKSAAVVGYERAVEGAFREVADALVSRASIEAELTAQVARVAAEERRFRLSELRYRSGVDSYLTLLTAQRDLFAARQQLIQTRLDRLTNLIDLYQALGGGWTERAAPGAGG